MDSIFTAFNSFALLGLLVAYLLLWRKHTTALEKQAADIDTLCEALAKLVAEFQEVNDTLEHSRCYKSTRIEYNLRKSGSLRGAPGAEAILKSIFGDKIKFRARTVNIESQTFGDDIRSLDSDLLHELLSQMSDSQKYRQAGAIQRELDRRGAHNKPPQ